MDDKAPGNDDTLDQIHISRQINIAQDLFNLEIQKRSLLLPSRLLCMGILFSI